MAASEPNSGQRVLVTGGAGYIGSHTCLELLQAGHSVTLFLYFLSLLAVFLLPGMYMAYVMPSFV